MTPKPTIPALTSIRGIAAWWVVLYHFREYVPFFGIPFLRDIAAAGYLAVDLFFVLSGFVIFLNYGKWFSTMEYGHFVKFISARVARVYPLHLIVLLVFLINPIALLFSSHPGQLGKLYDPLYFFLSLLMIQNWGLVGHLGWNIPAWSISTEWFAYLAFPMIAHFLGRHASRGTQTLFILAATLLVLATLFYWQGATDIGSDIPYLGLPRCFGEFVAGICICQLYHRYADEKRVVMLSSATILLSLMLCTILPSYAWAPALFCALTFSLSTASGVIEKVMALRWLLFFGEISYSTYMIHFLLKHWVKFLLVKTDGPQVTATLVYLIAVFLGSVLLHRFVELPGRKLISGRYRTKAVAVASTQPSS